MMYHSTKRGKMQNFINSVLRFIKYPIALLLLGAFYPMSMALFHMIIQTFRMDILLYFLMPIVGVMILWGVIPGLNGSALTIFAHEATHMLAAVLTFHKPKGMSIRQGEGGSFSYTGKGNWLITIAPYFFPTFPFLWMLGGLWFSYHNQVFPIWYIMTFGFLVGYHIVSNFYQIHSEQTDFKKAGYLFSIMFIPGANILLIGYLWSFVLNGWSGLSHWQQMAFLECSKFTREVFQLIIRYIS